MTADLYPRTRVYLNNPRTRVHLHARPQPRVHAGTPRTTAKPAILMLGTAGQTPGTER